MDNTQSSSTQIAVKTNSHHDQYRRCNLVLTIDDCPPFPQVPGVTFKHCLGLPGYSVDSEGTLWSCRNVSWNAVATERQWIPMRPAFHPDGYRITTVRCNGKSKPIKICRLVAEAFIGPRPNGLEVCHCDGNPANDRPENLRWDTHAANMQDTVRHGTCAGFLCAGEGNPKAKLTLQQVSEIRTLAKQAGVTRVSIFRRYGISRTQLHRILCNESWATDAPRSSGL